ncbi:MAG TPA: hypothetical protein VG963_19880, partial [Polyangiaceae bacterium]|nr:hypothetical protein [Polyangiaceae bacterium]
MLAHACGNETKATRAVVEISSDIKDLTSVQIEVSDGQPEGSTKTATFPVAADRNSNFLLSFAIAPSPGHEDGTFSVIATGLDADGVFLVQQRQAGSFAPKAFRTIKVWLGQLCEGVMCTDPGETCSDAVLVDGKGQCAPLGTDCPDGQEPSQADASVTLDASGSKDAGTYLDSQAEAILDAGMEAPISVMSQTCDQEGSLRCAMSGTPLRQRCKDGRWIEDDPCSESEVCDPSAADAGGCRAPLEICKGSAGQAVCDGATM